MSDEEKADIIKKDLEYIRDIYEIALEKQRDFEKERRRNLVIVCVVMWVIGFLVFYLRNSFLAVWCNSFIKTEIA